MDNLPNAIVIVGIGFLSIWGTYLWIDWLDNIYIAIGLILAFLVAVGTWVYLDNDTNKKQKRLKIRKMELENRKLELELEKLKKEMK